MLGNGFIGIVTKRAVGRSAAITYSPAQVRRMLQAGAAEAVRRERRGDFKPFTMERPYRVEFMLRRSFPDSIVTAIAALHGVQARAHRATAASASSPTARGRWATSSTPSKRWCSDEARARCRGAALRPAAPGRGAAPGAPRDACPRDTTPPAAYFGVTEYQLARREARAGHAARRVHASTSSPTWRGWPAAVRNATEMRPVSAGRLAAARAVPRGADRRGERAHRRRARRGRDPVHRERGAWRHPLPQRAARDSSTPRRS